MAPMGTIHGILFEHILQLCADHCWNFTEQTSFDSEIGVGQSKKCYGFAVSFQIDCLVLQYDNSGDRELVEELGLQMDDLRGDRQDILAEAAERTDLQARMNDMIAFLEEIPAAVTEYSEALARRLIEKVTIFDEKIVVELKSGLQMEVEE